MDTPSSSTPGKPRWVMRILSWFFCGTTAIGLLSMLSAPAVFPGVCFFGIFAAMFIVLAKSPKDKPCIFGREQGTKKSVFVIGCLIAAFVLISIITPPADSSSAPAKTEVTSAAPEEQPAEQPAPALQQAEPAPAPQPAESQQKPEEKPAPAPVELICNLEQFGGISSEELIAILGKPDEIGEDELDMFGVPAMRYKYQNNEALGGVEFVLVDDKVVYLCTFKISYPFCGKDAIFTQFGIKRGKDCVKDADSEHALSYECPSDKIDRIWIQRHGKDAFTAVSVYYDLRLKNEWHKSLNKSEKNHYQVAAENAIKGILKLPKSADFPWPDGWRFGANRIYTFASSYVDAKNPMGVELRSDFTVIFLTNTEHPVYIEFDGKVVLYDGYVSVDEVKARIAEKHAKSKKKK